MILTIKRLALFSVFVAVFCRSLPAQEAPPPVTVKVKAGQLAVLRSGAAGEVAWVWDRRQLPEAQVYQDKAGKALIIGSAGPDAPATSVVYFVSCVEHGAKGFVQTDWLVTFTGPTKPTDPDPRPGDLYAVLKAAYDADVAAGKMKRAELVNLAQGFGTSAPFIDLATTTEFFYKALNLILSRAVTPGDMPKTLPAIIARLEQVVPMKSDMRLTPELRVGLRTAFSELARTFERLLGEEPQPPVIPSSGFRVVFVYDANTTREQLAVINGKAIAAYLDMATTKDSKGRPAWKRWDRQVSTDGEGEDWRALWAAAKPRLKTLPVVVISLDNSAEIVPLPSTEAETLKLLRQYGGRK